jgi:outer membrane murein-binding lipoprotein Lpp
MSDFSHPAIGAALSAAVTLLGMEAVFIGNLTDDTFTFVRAQGRWRGVTPGEGCPRNDSMCARMLAGAPVATADAAKDPHYSDVPLRARLGITSYVGVPLRNEAGNLLGTLAGIDRRSVPIDGVALATLRHLATTIVRVEQAARGEASSVSATPTPATRPTDMSGRAASTTAAVAPSTGTHGDAPLAIVRTANGWRVGDDDSEDLTMAMVLADLLADDLSGGNRPEKCDEDADEVQRLRVAVAQLEHALAARIVIEQAIGVIAERFGAKPRDAFEDLRRSSRASGRRVYDVAREVTLSASQDVPTLPGKLRRS